MVHLTLALFALPDAPQLAEYQAFILSKFPSWAEAGVGAYIYIADNIANTYFPGPPDFLSGLMGLALLPGAVNASEIYAILYPAIEEAKIRFPNTNVTVVALPETFDSFQGWWEKYFDSGDAGYSSYLSSRLFDNETLSDVDSVAATLKEYLQPSGMVLTHLVAGKGVREAKPRGGGTSVHPAWRKSYVHLVRGQTFESHNETARIEAREAVERSSKILAALSPDTGAYLNEVGSLPVQTNKWLWTNGLLFRVGVNL